MLSAEIANVLNPSYEHFNDFDMYASGSIAILWNTVAKTHKLNKRTICVVTGVINLSCVLTVDVLLPPSGDWENLQPTKTNLLRRSYLL